MNKNVSPPVSSSVGSLAFSVSQRSSPTEMMLSLHSDAANAVPFAGQPMTGDQCIVDGEQIDLTSIFFFLQHQMFIPFSVTDSET